MKIKSVTIEGLRGAARRVTFGKVDLFFGPMGSGKTTVLGAVAYALTGRLPGARGKTIDDLLPFASDHAKGFNVALSATMLDDELAVERAVTRRGGHELFVRLASGKTYAKSDAEAFLRSAFGDVEWFVDALDPERSFLQQSEDKRRAWLFELCASASGWTVERLKAEMGETGDDWAWSVGKNVPSNVEINIGRLGDLVRATQKVLREAKVIAEGIAVPASSSTDARALQAAQAERDKTAEDVTLAEEALRHAKTRLAEFEAKRDQVMLAMPRSPTKRAELEASVEASIQALLALDIELAFLPQEPCPTCGGPPKALREAMARRETLDRQLTNLRTLLHAYEDPSDVDALRAHLDRAQEAHGKATDKLDELRRAEGILREQAGQATAATRAEERLAEVKKLLARATAVRDRMLADSIGPVQRALSTLNSLAPRGLWVLSQSGEIRYAEGKLVVGYSTMSAGERYCATIAMLIATSIVRREPWVGLFLDGFEAVSYEARVRAIEALVELSARGVVDNVFIAQVSDTIGEARTIKGAEYHPQTARPDEPTRQGATA